MNMVDNMVDTGGKRQLVDTGGKRKLAEGRAEGHVLLFCKKGARLWILGRGREDPKIDERATSNMLQQLLTPTT